MMVSFRFMLLGVGHAVMGKSIVSDVMPTEGALVEDPAFAVGKRVERVVISLDRAGSSDRCELRVELEDEKYDDRREFDERKAQCIERGWGGDDSALRQPHRVSPEGVVFVEGNDADGSRLS